MTQKPNCLQSFPVSKGAEPFFLLEETKIIKKIKSILAGQCSVSEKEKFLLEQVHLVCLFRKTEDDTKRNKLFQKIQLREEHGKELGFSSEDLLDLNHWITYQDRLGKLEDLLKEVKRRARK